MQKEIERYLKRTLLKLSETTNIVARSTMLRSGTDRVRSAIKCLSMKGHSMKIRPIRNRLLWIALGVSVVIAVYRIGFHIPAPSFDEEALRRATESVKQNETVPFQN